MNSPDLPPSVTEPQNGAPPISGLGQFLTAPPQSNNGRWRHWIILVSIFALAFFLRALIAMTLGWGGDEIYKNWSEKEYFGGISSFYLNIGDGIFRGDGYPTMSYPPGYPFFLGLFHTCGMSIDSIRLVQAALDSSLVFAISIILCRLSFQLPSRYVAAFLFALSPVMSFGAVTVLGESLSPFFLGWGLAGMASFIPDRGFWRWSLLGAFLGCAVLVRPDLLLLIIPAALTACMIAGWKNRVARVLAVIIGCFLMLLPWGIHNRVTHGAWVFTSTSGSYTLWAGVGQYSSDLGFYVDDIRASKVIQSKGMTWHSVEAERYFRDEYLRAWQEHPGLLTKYILMRQGEIMHLISLPPAEIIASPVLRSMTQIFHSWGGLVWTVFAVVGLFYTRRWLAVFFIMAPMLYALGSLGLIYFEPRYIRYAQLGHFLAAGVILETIWWYVWASRQFRFSSVATRVLTVLLSITVIVISATWMFAYLAAKRQGVWEATLDHVAPTDFSPRYTLKTLDWLPFGSGVTIDPQPTTLNITCRPQANYQCFATLITPDASAIEIEFDIEVKNGRIVLGALQGDQVAFIKQTKPLGAGNHKGRLIASTRSQSSVTLMMINNPTPDQAGPTEVVIYKTDVRVLIDPERRDRLPPDFNDLLQRRTREAVGLAVSQPISQHPWKGLIPDVQYTDLVTEIAFTTSAAPTAYQLGFPIDAKGIIAVKLDYTIYVEHGRCGLGVLSNDHVRWLAQSPALDPGLNRGSLLVSTSGEGAVHVVLYNNRTEDGASGGVIKALIVKKASEDPSPNPPETAP